MSAAKVKVAPKAKQRTAKTPQQRAEAEVALKRRVLERIEKKLDAARQEVESLAEQHEVAGLDLAYAQQSPHLPAVGPHEDNAGGTA